MKLLEVVIMALGLYTASIKTALFNNFSKFKFVIIQIC